MDNGANSYIRFLNGDKEGFVEIVTEYRDGLVLFINSFVNDYHISEEAADNALMQLYMKKPRYKNGHSFRAWIYTIGKNAALDYIKKHKRKKTDSIEDYYYVSDETDIESDYIKGEQNKMIHFAIKKLRKEYAQVLYLTYFEDLSVSETAEIMGKSKRQVSNLIYRAKNALREELEGGK